MNLILMNRFKSYLPIMCDADDLPSWICHLSNQYFIIAISTFNIMWNAILHTCNQSNRHSLEFSTLNMVNDTLSTLFSSVLISQAHRELCMYVKFDDGYFNVPLNESKTPPQVRASTWQYLPVRPAGHKHRKPLNLDLLPKNVGGSNICVPKESCQFG